MIVSTEKGFIFARVPKTASTAVANALRRYQRHQDEALLSKLVRRVTFGRAGGRFLNFGANSHLTMVAARHHLPREFFDKAFKFAVVRHPVDWTISYFHHLMRHRDDPAFRRDFAEVYAKPSLERFVAWRSEHFAAPQIAQLIDTKGEVLVDSVVRLERLDLELSPHLARIDPDLRVGVENRGGYERPEISTPLRRIIEKIHAADYEHFGYGTSSIQREPRLVRSPATEAIGREIARIGPLRFAVWEVFDRMDAAGETRRALSRGVLNRPIAQPRSPAPRGSTSRTGAR